MDLEVRPCTRLINGIPCGAPSQEIAAFKQRIALELRNYPPETWPRQFSCKLGHTVTDNIQPPLVERAVDPERCRSHFEQKPCARCERRREKRRADRLAATVSA